MTKSRQEPSIDTIATECIAVRLRLINRVVTGIYDDALRPLGIKVSQMNILVATAKMKIARPAEICRILQLDASTLSRNVERMIARGWLETIPDDDGRAQPFRLTVVGQKLLRSAAPAWQRAQHQTRELLGEATVKHLRRAAGRAAKWN